MLRRIKVDKDIERRISIGFIVSEAFTKKVKASYKPEYMEIDYVRMVIDWCLDYFNQYNKSPMNHIQDIFDTEKESLKNEVADSIEMFLTDISDEYERSQNINVDYLTNQAKDYFRRRSLEILFEKGGKLAKSGKLAQAEKLLLEHKQVAKATSEWFNPVFDHPFFNPHMYTAFYLYTEQPVLFVK